MSIESVAVRVSHLIDDVSRLGWNGPETKPEHIGWYETKFHHPGDPGIKHYSYWDGKEWSTSVNSIFVMLYTHSARKIRLLRGNQDKSWRGISHEVYDNLRREFDYTFNELVHTTH